MSNVHGLFSNRDNDSSDEDDSNNRFVGGISDRGGGRCVYYCYWNDVSDQEEDGLIQDNTHGIFRFSLLSYYPNLIQSRTF